VPIHLYAGASLGLRAFEIGRRYQQSAYDCLYVALAEQEGIELWTGDERLSRAMSGPFPFVRFLADYTPVRSRP